MPYLTSFTSSVVPKKDEMAPGNSITKLAAWSGWWDGVIPRKTSAVGISWSILTVWWHPTAPCASSGKCAVYPQGSQIIGSEELKTGKICQITEHMPLPVSAVVPDTARVRSQILQLISVKRPKGVGCIFLYLISNMHNCSESLLLCAGGWKPEFNSWVWSLSGPD